MLALMQPDPNSGRLYEQSLAALLAPMHQPGLLPRSYKFDGFLCRPLFKLDLTRVYLLLALTLINLIGLYISDNQQLKRALPQAERPSCFGGFGRALPIDY